MYLGIDCGTQGTKALLTDDRGRVLGRGYAAHAIMERPNGAREQEPQWWVEALKSSVREALAGTPEASHAVKALGVSGQQHGLVVLDAATEVIRPAKLWNDTETAAQNAALIERMGGAQAWFERFGIVPLTGYTVSKLLWLKQQHPEGFARVRHILLPHEYLNWWLTGAFCAEPGDASGTAYFDPRSRQWARAVLDEIDGGTGHLAAALPRLVDASKPIGTLRPMVAAELGLPGDCLVATGGGDNMMGAIGTGNVREGVVTLSLGTSATVYSFSTRPVADAKGAIAPFCSSSGGWLPLVCTMNATNAVNSILSLVGKTVADIDPALASTAPGADGLTMLPFLNGERTPDLPAARGTMAGLSSSNLTAQHMIRAVVEGVSFGVLNGLDLVLSGRQAEALQVIGGGARSAAWRQLLADSTGVAVTLPGEEEAGCLGAVVQAWVQWHAAQSRPISYEEGWSVFAAKDGARTTEPNPALRAGYDAARRLYAQRLREVYAV